MSTLSLSPTRVPTYPIPTYQVPLPSAPLPIIIQRLPSAATKTMAITVDISSSTPCDTNGNLLAFPVTSTTQPSVRLTAPLVSSLTG